MNRKRTHEEIVAHLSEHLAGEGTLNDCVTDDLYREWHNITDGRDTDLETVEWWAMSVLKPK